MGLYAQFRCSSCGHNFKMHFGEEYHLGPDGTRILHVTSGEESSGQKPVSGFLVDYYCPETGEVEGVPVQWNRNYDRFTAYLLLTVRDYVGELDNRHSTETSFRVYRAQELMRVTKTPDDYLRDLEADLSLWRQSLERKLMYLARKGGSMEVSGRPVDLGLDDAELDPMHATIELELPEALREEILAPPSDDVDFDEVLDLYPNFDPNPKVLQNLIERRKRYLNEQTARLEALKALYSSNPADTELQPVCCPSCGKATMVAEV